MAEQTFVEKVTSGFYSITALNKMIMQAKAQLSSGVVNEANRPSTLKKIKLMEDYIKSKCTTVPVTASKPTENTPVKATRKIITLNKTTTAITGGDSVVTDEHVARKFLQVKESAKERGIEFGLNLTSVRNLLKAKRCHYTSLPFDHKDTEASLTFDRLDYKKGYIKGNVVACRKSVNDLKNVLIEHPVSVFKDNPALLKKAVEKWIIS